jgi:alkylated DNA repair protein alkB family protein 4
MDDPVSLPEFLRRPPEQGVHSGDSNVDIHAFDPESQSAPGCPDFAGVALLPDFISESESERLLEVIERTSFVPAQSGKQKQHFGPKVNFNKRKVNVSAFEGLPSYAGGLELRLRQRLERSGEGAAPDLAGPRLRRAIGDFRTADVFVLRYRAEDQSNLDFHVDDTFAYGEAILDLSLESDSVLTFLRDRPGRHPAESWECVRISLPARSLLVLYGPARFEWEHAILAYDVRGRRTSLTMRSLSEELSRTWEGREVERLARRRLDQEFAEPE